MAEKKGFFAEFKAFAMRGNVIDLAVGMIIGSAFGTFSDTAFFVCLRPRVTVGIKRLRVPSTAIIALAVSVSVLGAVLWLCYTP